jgi:hypothetical protein
MTFRNATACAAMLCFLFTPVKLDAQERNPLNVHDRVQDLLFPLNVESKPYFLKLILRFPSDASQLALVVYPGGEAEIVRTTLDSMHARDLLQLVSKTLTENPHINEEEIVAKVKVRTTRFPTQYKTMEPILNDLRSIRISPFLNTRIGLDEVTWCDFWFDTGGQESVHYKVLGNSTLGDAQDSLARWMTRFRATCEGLVNRKS